ncbi:serine protease [Neobacillus sp. YIM B02564]|uniref:Serine protease n=1 Tax=Neobacillus paridis TaxID=2803862 RepID=A0ABS1TMG5_9BACI|nr:S1C family serine protease [Neobacillus paridis]MBL4952189.1 serine protease [Neobacillus paridis]
MYSLSPKSFIISIILSAMLGSTFTLFIQQFQARPIPTHQTISILKQNPPSIVNAVETSKRAVVGISVMRKNQSDGNPLTETGGGSGIYFDSSKGYIVTNSHVIEGADDVEVVLYDGSKVRAKVIGSDFFYDLAVLQVDPIIFYQKGIAPAILGDSTKLKQGETAIVIGNPLGEDFAQTVTAGIISSTNRKYPMKDEYGNTFWERVVLQTDAPINPGNSGGALINKKGEVIGVNNAKIAEQHVEGMGFAIPISQAKPILAQLIENGSVIRPALGIEAYTLQDLMETSRPNVPVQEGAVILHVSKETTQSGLKEGDCIVKLADRDVKNIVDLRTILFSHLPNEIVTVEFFRGNKKMTLQVKLIPLNLDKK